MDDEEEDMASQPIISQHWAPLPYRNFKTDEASGQHLPYATGPALPRCGDGPLGVDHNAQHCGPQPFALSHGNSEFQRSPVTSSPGPHSEPMEERGDRPALVEEEQRGQEEQEEEKEGGDEEDRGSAVRPAERAAVSVEVEIGRKLREIGDQFNRDHAELRMLPVWMRLAAALLGWLFPREAMVPQLRAEQR